MNEQDLDDIKKFMSMLNERMDAFESRLKYLEDGLNNLECRALTVEDADARDNEIYAFIQKTNYNTNDALNDSLSQMIDKYMEREKDINKQLENMFIKVQLQIKHNFFPSVGIIGRKKNKDRTGKEDKDESNIP